MAKTEDTIPLWTGTMPGGPANADGAEYLEDERIYNVREPALIARPAPAKIANGTAVIIMPGGSYNLLSIVKEGYEVADWLNSLGVSAFILKYRLKEYGQPAPLYDALQAVRLLRHRAKEFNLNPTRIGVLGFSAGGHLAASASTHFAESKYAADPALAAISARPDFTILLYPVISVHEPLVHAKSRTAMFGENSSKELLDYYSNELQVNKTTPMSFLVHGADDDAVPAENSILYYKALRQAGVPAELHLYQHAPHGFGLREIEGPANDWPKRCEEWMRFNGLIK
jgi:acetyl esterase/lipase